MEMSHSKFVFKLKDYLNRTHWPPGPTHILTINTPTKREKESPSDGHYQCDKEMEDHLLAC
jgi:hypothetical protein